MSNETVTYSLEAVLTRIEGKIDSLEKRVNERFDKVEDRLTLKSVEGTQKNQVWTLIILLGSAIITAGWKVFFSSNI
ncbi:MAG: DUF4164 family protein [Microcystis panniformis Mp_MB_F_20080800_S26]|nr:MAG: DUF4164 family protein [Microcystis panniformis Mp_MB_F_20080800_S26]